MFHPSIKSLPDEDISIFFTVDNHSHAYMVDCGHASGYNVKELQNVRALFLSHMHMDHFIGFDQMMRHQVGSGNKVTVCGPKGIANQLSAKLRAYTWNLVDPMAIEYEVREVISPELMYIYSLVPPIWETGLQRKIKANPVFANEEFEVRATILDHKTDSLAYRFDERSKIKIELRGTRFYGGPWVNQLKMAFENKNPEENIIIDGDTYQAKDLFDLLHTEVGQSLGVIMDHAATPANHQKIIECFQGCDLVYMECFFKIADKELAEKHAHSYSQASAEVLKKAKVKEAIPIHFSRKYKEQERQELVSEFMQYFEGV